MDIIIISLFLLGFISIGLYFSKTNKSSSDYFKGRGSIPWAIAMFSIVATETSVLTFIGVPSISYRTDWWFLQLAIGYIIGRTLVSFYLLPRYFSNDVVSIYELIGSHYGLAIQRFSSIVFLVTRLLADGIRFLATAIVFDVLTGWGIVNSVLIIGVVTLIYSYSGGIQSIIWIDSIQFFIYIAGGLISIYYLCTMMSSEAITSSIDIASSSIFHFSGSLITSGNLFINGIIGGTLLSFSSHGVDYMMVQRSLSCKDLSSAKKAMIGSGFFVFIQFSIFLFIGTLLKEFYQSIDLSALPADYISNGDVMKDRELPLFISSFLPIGVRGILIVGIMSAAMSTLSSSINALSSSTLRDIFQVKDDIGLSKKLSVFWAFILIVIASLFDESNNLLIITGLTIASFTYGILLTLFLLQLMNKKPADWIIITGSVAGVASVFLMQSYGITWTWFILVSTITNLSVVTGLSSFIGNHD